MKKWALLISFLLVASGCGSSSKQVKFNKGSKKNNAKHSTQKYVPAYGDDSSLEDMIYENLGHKRGTGVRYSSYVEQNGKFDIPVVYNDPVQKWIDYFTGRGRGHFERYLSRSGRFIPYMHSVLTRYNLPKDLVYLSMIESGFNTRAMSWAAAGGLWQFIRSTGAIYGLSADYYVDERADVEKATDAAARHLKDLYDEFGHWYLAFAAYNAGAGKVRNAINRDGYDFWDMARGSYLRQETKDYVPKILAASIIAKNPGKYGFRGINYQAPIDFERVKMRSATDLEVAGECAGVDPDLIRLLNPELLRDMTPPHVPTYSLKIPRGTRERFERRYASLSPSQRLKTIQYTVRSGDTVREIAANYGVSEKDLIAGNRDDIDTDREKRSGVERVRVGKGRKARFVNKKVKYYVTTYEVRPGTTLTIPKNRSVGRNASSRDDAAAHAAKDRFGLRLAQADLDTKGKGKSKKERKKLEQEEKRLAKAEQAAKPKEALEPLPEMAEARAEAKPPVRSDMDPSLLDEQPSSGSTQELAANEPQPASDALGQESSESAKNSTSSGTPLAFNDRPSGAVGSGTSTSPSDQELKEAVEKVRTDEPALEETAAAPADKKWVPEAAARKSPAKPVAPKYHLVKSGETLTGIANKYGVSVGSLKNWNGKKVVPHVKKGTKILVASGAAPAAKQAVSAPATAKRKAAAGPTSVAKAKPKAKSSVVRYKVKPGDSLITIAKRHSTTADEIKRLNGLKSPRIVPGAVLVLKSK